MLYIELAIKKSPAEVYRALTQADALTEWFAEHAHVSTDGGAYDFWGRHTPGAPDRDAGRHKLIESAQDQKLTFEWPYWADGSVVSINLTAIEDGTRLALQHKNAPPERRETVNPYDFWTLALQNLRSWTERGVLAPLPDFSKVPTGDVRHEIEIEAPPAAVFDALVNPEQLDRYIGDGSRVEPQVGGTYSYGWENRQSAYEDGPVKILDIKPNEKLSYSWRYSGEEEPITTVTWTLKGSGGRTRLTLVHSGFADDRVGGDYSTGWLKYMTAIKNMVEEGPEWESPRRGQQQPA